MCVHLKIQLKNMKSELENLISSVPLNCGFDIVFSKDTKNEDIPIQIFAKIFM